MLEVKHLSYEVTENQETLPIVTDISFTVNDGEMLVITGPNGGGKSTIARLLMGIIKETSGTILLDGEDITKLSIDERARAGIGFAFQQPASFKGMTVRRMLNLAAGKELPEPVSCRLLGSVGLCAKEYLDREVDATLSGGEKKRVEIATVLAKDHKVSVFDEPEAGIDLWSFSMLVKQFEKIHRSKAESLVLISHQERIIRMADRIMVVRDGRVEMIGDRDEILPKLFLEEQGCSCLDQEDAACGGREDMQEGGEGDAAGCGNR